jgi:copper(I)-binding protein
MKLPRRIMAIKVLSALFVTLFFNTGSYADSVSVTDGYVRAVPHGQPNSAAFMQLNNSGTENRALISAKSNISDVVELHTHINDNGMMRMRRVDKIDIKAGDITVLKPGGLHVMFIGLKQVLTAGEQVNLELVFDDDSHVTLALPVKAVAGMGHKPMHQPK